jgi:hypothetical protein
MIPDQHNPNFVHNYSEILHENLIPIENVFFCIYIRKGDNRELIVLAKDSKMSFIGTCLNHSNRLITILNNNYHFNTYKSILHIKMNYSLKIVNSFFK